MGGIAGWIDFNSDLRAEEKTVLKMSAAIKHRGENSGVSLAPECALISRESAPGKFDDGKQPLKKFDGGEEYTIVYDGTLYNAARLRSELIGKGRSFFGFSDAEIILTAFIEFGSAMPERLNGVFAFAIYAAREKSLFCARDRIGVKPLYYTEIPGGILFASEVKALFQNPSVHAEIGSDGLHQIFLLGPGKPQGKTIYDGIHELCQAEYLFFTKSGLKIKKYWRLTAKENLETLEEAAEHTRRLITDSIRLQTDPVGNFACFLSGGLDSGIISYVAAQKLKNADRRLSTLSIDYEDSEKYFKKNEFQPNRDNEYADCMSAFIGSEHIPVLLKTADVTDALSAAAVARDLPGMADIDSAMLLACRAAKKRFTTVLSGECADELFGGYPWYHKPELLYADTFPWSRSLTMRKSLVKPGILKGDAVDYVRAHYEKTVRAADSLDTDSKQDRRVREMFFLNFEWFMQNLLDRTERMSAQCGLEVRVPLCDYRLVEYAYNLPWALKAADGREKGIMRRAFRGLLPDKIIDRKKSPFPKTFDPAFVDAVKNGVRAMMSDRTSAARELINAEYLNDLLNADPYTADPWYGQLMRLPQVFAYLMQIDTLFKAYSVSVKPA